MMWSLIMETGISWQDWSVCVPTIGSFDLKKKKITYLFFLFLLGLYFSLDL